MERAEIKVTCLLKADDFRRVLSANVFCRFYRAIDLLIFFQERKPFGFDGIVNS